MAKRGRPRKILAASAPPSDSVPKKPPTLAQALAAKAKPARKASPPSTPKSRLAGVRL